MAGRVERRLRPAAAPGIGGSMYTRKPLQPNLERVNEAARIEPPQVLSEEPTAVTPARWVLWAKASNG